MTEVKASNGEAVNVASELARLGEELKTVQQELARRNAEYERIASYDTLTGLLNRRAILEKVNEWLLHVRRYKGHLTVAMLDIDHFKRVNDKYGHRAGDRVLADLSSMMQRSIRRTDFVGRYGGQEFLIILPRTDAAGAAVMAERVRASLEGVPMHDAEGNDFKVTASLGVAEYFDEDDEDSLISRADAALYRAKEAGRNRVEIAACPD
ncbi:GGDEF domain-containing protein [Chloroflexota bacterium]